jgi:hypothetical protein
MRWFRFIPVYCFIALVLGCGGIGFLYERRLAGNVGLVACDSREQMKVSLFPEAGDNMYAVLISETVFAVGWNESHVIAKRHPRDQPFGPIDKTQTEYYIVVVRGAKVHGPFDRAEFVLHCDLLGVAKNVDFTLTFPDLE